MLQYALSRELALLVRLRQLSLSSGCWLMGCLCTLATDLSKIKVDSSAAMAARRCCVVYSSPRKSRRAIAGTTMRRMYAVSSTRVSCRLFRLQPLGVRQQNRMMRLVIVSNERAYKTFNERERESVCVCVCEKERKKGVTDCGRSITLCDVFPRLVFLNFTEKYSTIACLFNGCPIGQTDRQTERQTYIHTYWHTSADICGSEESRETKERGVCCLWSTYRRVYRLSSVFFVSDHTTRLSR